MNEKIKELALQAGYSKDYLAIGLPSNMEKFVELIVQECIDYCGENLSKTVGGALKIHFGVAE
jgi:hypothetical protein